MHPNILLDSTLSSDPQTLAMSAPAFDPLERTISHGVLQRPLSTDEEMTFPQLTQAGPHTDAYQEVSPTGLVLAREAEQDVADAVRTRSQTTLVSRSHVGGKGFVDAEKGARLDDAKLVTWLPDDPENPRNWSLKKKW